MRGDDYVDFWDLQERQAFAAIIGIVLLIAVPAVVCAALGIATGWFIVLGGSKPSHALWGWLSHFHTEKGREVQNVGPIPGLYSLSIFTGYIVYQLGELLAACFRAFRNALR